MIINGYVLSDTKRISVLTSQLKENIMTIISMVCKSVNCLFPVVKLPSKKPLAKNRPYEFSKPHLRQYSLQYPFINKLQKYCCNIIEKCLFIEQFSTATKFAKAGKKQNVNKRTITDVHLSCKCMECNTKVTFGHEDDLLTYRRIQP